MGLVLCYKTAAVVIEITILYLHHSWPLKSRKKPVNIEICMQCRRTDKVYIIRV